MTPAHEHRPDLGSAAPAALTVARTVAHSAAEWAALAKSDDLVRALPIVDALDAFDTPGDLLRPDLRDMRLWRCEALLRQGRTDDARVALARAERDYGAGWQTRRIRGLLSYYAGDHGGAALLFSQALALLEPGVGLHPEFDGLARLWADALNLGGQNAQSRIIVERLFAGRAAWSNDNLTVLRQTVRTAEDLAAFRAFLAPMFAEQGSTSRAALYHDSMICRELGRFDEAEAIARHRFLTSVPLLAFGGRRVRRKAQASWTQHARTTLLDLNGALQAAGMDMFLISGTLLGCVRENDILGHDKDVDVGVFEGPGIDKRAVADALTRYGCFSIKPYPTDTLIRAQHASGVLIDVFWHRLEDGQVIHEGLKSKWWNTPFELVERSFLGETFLVPSDHDLYLQENYGQWRRPVTEFETFADTPNMIVTNIGEIMWYCYIKLTEYYYSGNLSGFIKIAETVLKHRPDERYLGEILHRLVDRAGDATPAA